MKYNFSVETDDLTDITLMINWGDYYSALFDIYNMARSELKHGVCTVESLEKVLEEIKVIAGNLIDG